MPELTMLRTDLDTMLTMPKWIKFVFDITGQLLFVLDGGLVMETSPVGETFRLLLHCIQPFHQLLSLFLIAVTDIENS